MNHPHTDDARFLELLERWLTGAFDRADERELHALAEADDFRREAWAGLSALPEAEHGQHLTRLRQRLQGKKNARRVVPFGIWASAAALLLVAVALYFWPEPPVDGQQPVAKTAEKTETAQDMTISANDIADAAPPPAERDAPSSAPSPAATRPRSAEPAAGAISPQDDALAATAETLSEETAPTPSVAKTDQDAGPNRTETATSVPSQPSPAKPTTPALNQAKEKTAVDELAKPAVLERKKMDGSGAPQQPGSTAFALSAVPAGGWVAFRAYLRDNARLTDAARNNNVTGIVRLSFSIGTDGKPANVRVLQSLGHGCDEEAERLVRRFDWVPAGAVGVEVEVSFRR